jgi:hypothetical protein
MDRVVFRERFVFTDPEGIQWYSRPFSYKEMKNGEYLRHLRSAAKYLASRFTVEELSEKGV